MILDVAARHLSVQLPVTETELKRRFRELVFKAHPDQGGTSDAFRTLKEAYETIVSSGQIVITDAERLASKILRTIDGTPLTELGLGLGPNINGRDCESCERKGYRAVHEQRRMSCNRCDRTGYTYPCRDCAGSGKFMLRNGNQVQCRRCQGRGTYPARNPQHYPNPWFSAPPRGASVCRDCLGLGTVGEMTQVVSYHKCGNCNGTGEIKIYNPVILKGTMAGKR